MTCFSIPAMSHENEFTDLVWLGLYVDKLVESSGDNSYAIVYEWDGDSPGDGPLVAVLARLGGRWSRRVLPVHLSGK
jgi:hypothetical protein